MRPQSFDIAVIGAGASGIAAVGVLLAQKVQRILWIDPQFGAGRMPLYTKVPSNTKVRIFRDFINKCETFKKFTELKDQKENPMRHYEGLDPEKGCSLELCLHKLITLTHDIRKYFGSNVMFFQGQVQSLTQQQYKGSLEWLLKLQRENIIEELYAKAVILATGSKPRYFPEQMDFSKKYGIKNEYNLYSPESIDLDTALDPRLLQERVNAQDVVAVIGSSHSSMVVIKHLVELGQSPKRIICLYIEELKFAEYMPEGWILYDNTGLKGDVAEWVRNSLLKGKIPQVEMVLIDKAQNALKEKIPLCSKIIYTVGFERNPLPQITVTSGAIEERKITYNPRTSEIEIMDSGNRKVVEGLYGCGIGWPEQTTDPRGNVEFAVGLMKFMNYANRVIPDVVVWKLRMQEIGKGKL